MCDCEKCPIVENVIPFHEKYIVPSSKRAWENTKHDFHAGYNKACQDMAKRLQKATLSMK